MASNGKRPRTRTGPASPHSGNPAYEKGCRHKAPYTELDGYHGARRAAHLARERTRENIQPYHCQFCGLYHIGHADSPARIRLLEDTIKRLEARCHALSGRNAYLEAAWHLGEGPEEHMSIGDEKMAGGPITPMTGVAALIAGKAITALTARDENFHTAVANWQDAARRLVDAKLAYEKAEAAAGERATGTVDEKKRYIRAQCEAERRTMLEAEVNASAAYHVMRNYRAGSDEGEDFSHRGATGDGISTSSARAGAAATAAVAAAVAAGGGE